MRVIAIINQKGGCGKTTTSINLAACLARLGQRTLLVDLDPQGHCAVGLAVPEDQVERSILETLIEPTDTTTNGAVGSGGVGKPAKMAEVVWQIASDFDLAPSNLRLASFEQLFAGRPGRENRLSMALSQVRDRYKWVILDCPPSVGLITFNALKACDEVIVPVETGFFSLHGLSKMMQTLAVMKEKADKDVRVRILPTLYDTRTKLAREVLSELRAKFKNELMESTVNFNTKLKEAASFGQPITEYDPGSRGYKDFVNLARELMGQRPLEIEESPGEPMTRPAELVQRAKALANLTNLQFGRNLVQMQPGSGGGNGFGGAGGGMGAGMGGGPGKLVGASVGGSSLASAGVSGMNGGMNGGMGVGGPFGASAMSGGLTGPALANMSLETESENESAVATMMPPMTSTATVSPSAVSMMTPSMVSSGATPAMALLSEIPELGPITETAPVVTRMKTTEEKLAEFYGVRRMGSEVCFAAHFEQAGAVELAGDFNNWSPSATPMRADAAGRWVTALPLQPGRYRYRLVVDGRWITDPNNSYVESNQFGELNNVVEVD